MRLYINNLNLKNLSHFMSCLSEYLVCRENYTLIYSIDGIYKATKNIVKLEPFDNSIEIINNYYEVFSLIVDTSYFNEIETYNIDPEHISTKIKRYIYKINKNSNIKLIIEGLDIEEFIPNDLYFELSSNLRVHDILVKKELFVFLSLLK